MPWAQSWFLPSRAREMLDRRFNNNLEHIGGEKWPRGLAPELAALLKVLENVDQRVLNETLSVEEGLEWIQNLERVSTTVRQWEGGGHDDFYFPPLIRLYALLKKCPDEPAPAALPRLTFIRDKKLRETIAHDVEAVGRLLRSEEWKPATVIGGSVIEALLLDRLERRGTKAKALAYGPAQAAAGDKRPWKGRSLDKWDLWQLVAVAKGLALIDDGAAGACDAARDFRNLIHPGRERAEVKADKGTAHVVYGALHRLMALFGDKR